MQIEVLSIVDTPEMGISCVSSRVNIKNRAKISFFLKVKVSNPLIYTKKNESIESSNKF